MLGRDAGILLLSICALYVSLHNEGPFTFQKAWFHQFDGQGGLLDTPQHLPPPISADLNGDGRPEVIIAVPGGAIQLLAPRHPGNGFAAAGVLAGIAISPLIQPPPAKPVHIAAFKTGYLNPMPKELVMAPRKQVLVVVTTDLHVLCLDHNLKPMWQKHLLKHFTSTPHGTIRELAVHISEHAINKGDKGVVVIGASVTPQTLGDREDNEDALDAEMNAEAMAKLHAKGRQFGQGTRDVDTTTTGRHFSYFAFEGSKGEDRWQHDAGDWHRDMGALADETMDQHSYHMKAERENAMHYGEASCKDYREAVLAAFPHSWSSPRDTRFKLAHFHKHRSGKGAQKELLTKLASGGSGSAADKKDSATGTTTTTGSTTSNSVVGRVVGSLVNGAARGARRGSNGNTGDVITGGIDLLKNHTSAPNVLVTHLEEGLEAIHLYSGRTICRLFLANPGLHADLNKDGIPDHIIAIGGSPKSLQLDGAMDAVDTEHHHNHRHHGFCYAVVKSGIPARQHLFDGGICRPFTGGLHGLDRVNQLRPVDVATPILLPVPGRRGKYRRGGGNMAVFLNSRGEVTAYDGQGHKMWQVRTAAGWLGRRGHHWGEEDGDEDQDEEEMHMQGAGRGRGGQWLIEPTMVAMPLRTHAIPTVILAGGGDAFAVISERGHILDQFDLPATPDQPLVITDFNFDGLNDIVMVSSDGIYGWTQVRRPGALPFSALVGGLIVIMVAVWINQQGFMKGGDGSSGGSGGVGRRKGRSTDRVD